MKTSLKIKLALVAISLLLLPAILTSCCCCCLTTTGTTLAILGSSSNGDSTPEYPDGSNSITYPDEFEPGYGRPDTDKGESGDDAWQSGGGATEKPEPTMVTIDFVTNGGEEMGTISLKNGDSLPEAYRPGFTFGGWY